MMKILSADKIFYNGVIYTMEAEGETVSAVVVRDGRIIYAGTDEAALAYPAAKTEDLNGQTVLPGFNDTHIHISLDLLHRSYVDLSRERTISGVIERMREANDGGAEWLIGVSLAVGSLADGRYPDRHDLDKIDTERPVVINSACGHIKLMNSNAVERAGIPGRDTAYNAFLEYSDDGAPNGIFLENSYAAYVDERIDGIYEDDGKRKALIRNGIGGYSAMGLTTMHTVSDAPEETQTEYIDQYFELEERGELPVRVVIHPTLQLPWAHCPQTGFGTDMVKTGGLKIFLDGALGGRTAALLEPYSDAPDETGVLNFTEEELRAQIRGAYNAGLEVSIHAIGDAAMERVLNAAEAVYPLSDEEDPAERLRAAGKRRLRIIHAMVIQEAHIERLKRLPVILDVQPGFIDDDAEFAEDRLGPERVRYFMPHNLYMKNGILIAGGSDYPFGGKPPLAAIQISVTRQTLNGFPDGGLVPEEAVTVFEAVSMHTRNAAYCSSEEKLKGTITPGKFADFVVLGRDIFKTPLNEIADIKILKTVVGGKETFAAGLEE
ncbi:MAG: amidohydrolase [Clostridiales Family XIII bacterium]|jgi:predicted amidohydrolase YtcJ|nr:amidohydrolase [Clostridiales Family XIII bacterium]